MSIVSSIRRLAVFAAVGTVVAAAPAAAELRIIVTEQTIPVVANSVMWLADQLGYYERAGVDVEIIKVSDTPTAVTALLAGEGDMANISVTAALGIAAQALDQHIGADFLPAQIARTQWRCNGFGLVRPARVTRRACGRLSRRRIWIQFCAVRRFVHLQ